MTPVLQQQGGVGSLEHQTVAIRAQLVQRSPLSICQLSPLILIQKAFQSALLGRRMTAA